MTIIAGLSLSGHLLPGKLAVNLFSGGSFLSCTLLCGSGGCFCFGSCGSGFSFLLSHFLGLSLVLCYFSFHASLGIEFLLACY